MEQPNKPNRSYHHVLQKLGVLKSFSVAKIVNKKDVDELKQLIREVSTSESEYEKLLAEEMLKLADMHSSSAPIPGIIYIETSKDTEQILKQLQVAAKAYAAKMNRTKDITKKQMCFLVAAIIKELGLTKEDFLKLNEDNESEDDE